MEAKADTDFIDSLTQEVIDGGDTSFEDAWRLWLLDARYFMRLVEAANKINRRYRGTVVEVEALLNARSGRCPEDCSFCSQSTFFTTDAPKYSLLPPEKILEAAIEAEKKGATKFCIVVSGRGPSDTDIKTICAGVRLIKERTCLEVHTSLGELTREKALALKEAGVKRYNHNLEAAPSFFSKIVTTHTFEDRVRTARLVKEIGLELCSGGIIGMGESVKERIELAFWLREVGSDEVPVNILNPRPGTPLAQVTPLAPVEAIKTIAIFRFVLPRSIIKIAGGREVNLRDLQPLGLLAGADGLILGGYLTTPGRDPKLDLQMIRDLGLEVV